MIKRKFGFAGRKTARRIASLADIRAWASDIKAALRAAKGQVERRVHVADLARGLAICTGAIQGIAERTRIALDQLAAKRAAAGDYFRLLQATNGVFRTPEVADRLTTILLTMIFCLLEGGMAAAVLISEGRMGVPAGLTYGLVFALVNIIAGLVIGYLPLRYLAYRSPIDLAASDAATGQAGRARMIRWLAAFGLGVGLAAEGVLIFGAARLRALGSHEGVFDFSEVGFWTTFDDSLAIIIVVIGVCSVTLAIRKGYGGISDPIPGYAEAYLQATGEMEDAADELADEAQEAIEAACETALENAEDLLEEVQEAPGETEDRLSEIARDIDAFNDSLRAAQEDAQRRLRKKQGLAAFVGGRKRKPQGSSDLGAYEALILPGIDTLIEETRAAHAADLVPLETAMAELETAREQQLADIRTALAAFRAGAPNLDTLIDEEGDDHG